MASSGWVVGVFSGKPQFDVILNVWRHSTSGNSTRWSWSLTARQFTAYDSWHLDPVGGTVNVEGENFGISHNLDFRGSVTEITLGSGTTGWKTHSSTGYLTVNFSFSFGPGGAFGSASGSNSFSADRIPKVPSAPPAPVYQSRTTNSLTFTISQPSDNGGSAITTYRMQVTTNPSWPSNGSGIVADWTSGSTWQTTPAVLEPATTYYVRYMAQNAVGLGNASSAVTMTTAAGPPTVPRFPVLEDATPTSVRLDWDAPADNNGAAITGYTIQRALNAAFTQGNTSYNQGTATERTFTDLDPSTTYYFRIRATNSAGNSGWSEVVSLTTVSGAYYSNGSSWLSCGVFASVSGEWVPCEIYVSDGTTWEPAI